MLKRFEQLAERAATDVSRRQFLGRLGQGALLAVGMLSGVLVLPGTSGAKPLLCGINSGDCAGRNPGDPCGSFRDDRGRCKRIRGKGDCYCAQLR